MPRYTTVDEFLKAYQNANQELETIEHKRVGSSYVMEVVTRFRPLEFTPVNLGIYHPVDFSAHKVGYLNGHQIILDKYLCYPKVEPTDAFCRIQHPDLVYQTREWMRDFFGMVYPVVVTQERIVMHPLAFDRLQNLMIGIK